MRHFILRSRSILCTALGGLAIASWGTAIAQDLPSSTSDRADLTDCPAPAADEYLVLAVAREGSDQDAAIALVGDRDADLETQVCRYLNEIVVHVAGFEASSAASDLARNLTNELGLSAFVTRLPEAEPADPFEPRPYGEALDLPDVQVVEARPASGTVTTAPAEALADEADAPDEPDEPEPETDAAADDELPVFTPEDLPPPDMEDAEDADDAEDTDDRNLVQPPFRLTDTDDRVPSPTGITPIEPNLPPEVRITDDTIARAFTPQPLADGYVVLVDYFSDPSVAAEVAAVTRQAVGLVSYAQRPFLMADFALEESEANATFEALSDAGLWTMVVDSRRAILLTPRVELDP